MPGHRVDPGPIPAGSDPVQADAVTSREDLDEIGDDRVGGGIDLTDETGRLHHLFVHPHLGLAPFDRTGQDVVETSVTGQPTRGIVEPGLRVEVEPLQGGEAGIGHRFGLGKERRL
jgi:hypothetical protein